MAGRVRVCNEGPHFLIEVRRGRGESRKPTFDVDLEAAMRINKTSNAGIRLKVKILTSGVPQEGQECSPQMDANEGPPRDCRRGQTRPPRT